MKEFLLHPHSFIMKNDLINEDTMSRDNDALSDAFIRVEESIKSFHAILDTVNQDSSSLPLSEEDLKSRFVASQALRDSASIYLDWGWHYLSRLYNVSNPHNPEDDLLI